MRKLIVAFLSWLLNEVDPQFTALAFVFFDGKTTHKVNNMNTQLNDNGTTTLIAHCVSAAGNPAGAPTWTSSDTSIVNVTPAADGMSCTVVAVGKLGTATVTAIAGNLTATDDITIVAGPAVSLTLTESTLTAS